MSGVKKREPTPGFVGRAKARTRSVTWVLRLAWASAPLLVASMVGITLATSITPAGLALVAKSLIDVVTSEIASGSPQASEVMPWFLLGLLLAIIDSVFSSLLRYLSSRLSDDLHLEISAKVMSHASELEIEFFEDLKNQDLLQRAKEVTGPNLTALVTNTFQTASAVFQIVSLSAVLTAIQPATLLVIAVVGPPFVWMRYLLANRAYKLEYSRATKRRWSRYFVSTLTDKGHVAESRLLGLAPLISRKHLALITEFRDQDRKIYAADLYTVLAFGLVASAAFYGLLVEVALRALDGQASLGDVAVFFGASARLRSGVETGADRLARTLRRSLAVSQLLEFFDFENRPPSAGESVEPMEPEDARAIAIEDIHFAYPGSPETALRGVTFDIRAGETVALVGENGSGKTTLVKLLARLYTPDRGRISLDGRDIQDLEIRSLHRQIAFIFQNFNHYEATAGENIAYGDWEQCLDDPERIEEVARAAGVHEMIMAMPESYDTLLGRTFGTFELSGGQWQKLAVARAFARRSSLLILDEPTSALDARAEYELFVRARELAHGRTTILISHRFSTVSMADRILVMDEGRIIEQGSHDDLLEQRGHYAELYSLHQHQMAGRHRHADDSTEVPRVEPWPDGQLDDSEA